MQTHMKYTYYEKHFSTSLSAIYNVIQYNTMRCTYDCNFRNEWCVGTPLSDAFACGINVNINKLICKTFLYLIN